ncbi:MAG: DUF2752 domain-containing protein [Nonlabens sp.]
MDCPGCGIQRSISFLLQGNLEASIKMYPALIPAIILVLVLLINLVWDFKFAEKLKLWLTILVLSTVFISYFSKIFFPYGF